MEYIVIKIVFVKNFNVVGLRYDVILWKILQSKLSKHLSMVYKFIQALISA